VVFRVRAGVSRTVTTYLISGVFRTDEETDVVDLPFEDRTDFEDAGRGLIGSLDPGVVKDAAGRR
jgi:alkyl sulfatase BDS1-like metallo-beta-lactamase superfamily hydrolase